MVNKRPAATTASLCVRTIQTTTAPSVSVITSLKYQTMDNSIALSGTAWTHSFQNLSFSNDSSESWGSVKQSKPPVSECSISCENTDYGHPTSRSE